MSVIDARLHVEVGDESDDMLDNGAMISDVSGGPSDLSRNEEEEGEEDGQSEQPNSTSSASSSSSNESPEPSASHSSTNSSSGDRESDTDLEDLGWKEYFDDLR